MMAIIGDVHIALCDPLNPGFGYQLRITSSHGEELMHASVDTVTGKDLLTVEDALAVVRRVAQQARERR
jgi:hypothetical protein